MRFTLIDRIVDLQSGVSITAVKGLCLSEEYLQDHFPRFPVMPGVMMLESMYQASAWLVRKSEDFAHSIIMLKEAKNVKYADFVEPGEVLTVTAEIAKQDDRMTWLKARGTVDGKTAVSARLTLERFNLKERYPLRAESDPYVIRSLKKEFLLLHQPSGSLETVN